MRSGVAAESTQRGGFTVRHFASVLCFMLVIGTFLSALPAAAATTTVTSVADDGSAGTLRYAIANAASGDTINFSVTGIITLALGTLEISKDLTIAGPAAASLAISGNNMYTVFQIDSGFAVSISGVTIENGDSIGNGDGGGGIRNKGTLAVNNSLFSGNSTGCNCNAGGAIRNDGSLTVTGSTMLGNSAAYGGAIGNGGTAIVTTTTFASNGASFGGGIANFGSATVRVTNSTFSGNSAINGGGIENYGSATVTFSTFLGNSALNGGGGIFNDNNFNNASSLTLKNTVLANSFYGNCFVSTGSILSSGYNLSDDTSCTSFFTSTGDMNNTPAGLDPNGLQNNGGPTQTIALLATSPAVDAIPLSPTNYCTDVGGNPVTTDQRGIARPQGSACDIGAFELVQYAAQVQQPINPDGSSVFSVKRGVVPVKFTLTLGGVSTCSLPPATISLVRTAGSVVGSIDESTYLLASDSGSNFRIDTTSCQYVYNLGLSSLGTGTYTVNISIGGSVVGRGVFGLK